MKNCNSSSREPISPAASAWYTTPAWNAPGSTRYRQQDNNVEIEADTVTSIAGADRSTHVERSGMGHKRPRAAAVFSSRNSLSVPKTYHIPFPLPTHSPLDSSRFSTPFDMSSDEDITPPIDSSVIRHPRTGIVAISDRDWRLFSQKPMDTVDGSGRIKKYQVCIECENFSKSFSAHYRHTTAHRQHPEEDHATFHDRYETAAREMKSWHKKMEQACKFSTQTFRRFLFPDEVVSSEIAFLSTKRKLIYIGVFNESRDPIFDKYERFLKRNSAHGSTATRELELTRKAKYSLNLMRKMYYCLTDKIFTSPLTFLTDTEKTVTLLLTSIGHVTNTSTIKNYRSALFEFLTYMSTELIEVGNNESIVTTRALMQYKERIDSSTNRAFLRNMELHRSEKMTERYQPYPFYSLLLKNLDLTVPEPLTNMTFSKYSLKVGLFIILMNGARPEMIYKIDRENVEKAYNTDEDTYWGLFRYYGKRRNLQATHVIDSELYDSIFKPYLIARSKIIKTYYPEHHTLSIKKGPLFFDSRGERFSKNINKLSKPIFENELNFDMDQHETTLYSWRKSAENVVEYLQYKGVEPTVVEDYTVTLRNHSSQVSLEYYGGRVVITDAIKRWKQLRFAETVYDPEDLRRYNSIASDDEDVHRKEIDNAILRISDDKDNEPPAKRSRKEQSDTKPESKIAIALGTENQRPAEYQDIMIPFLVNNMDVKKMHYLQLKKSGTENGKYTDEALRTMFNFVIFENCIWNELSNEVARKFLGRLKDYRKTNERISMLRTKRTLTVFRTLRICACLMISMKHLKIKKKHFFRNPEEHIEAIKNGVAKLGLKGTYRKGDHFEKTLKLLEHAVFYKYSVMDEYRMEHRNVYKLQKLHVE
uniref:Core-binding (CB) domain-containing protein n=1 Tax=Parastrongyloides trichosuri TaxID=131310 RepID=A0A0N4ZZI9_PARTI